LSWNEQYVLQAFLMHNRSYRLRLATNILLVERSIRMAELFGSNMPPGGSVWLEKVARD
jgi:hypothetical protein